MYIFALPTILLLKILSLGILYISEIIVKILRSTSENVIASAIITFCALGIGVYYAFR